MQSITLTQETHKIPPTVYMVQNDTGRMLRMVIADNSYESADIGSASVSIKRSDGSYYSIPATFDSDTDNTFVADPRQALTQPGITECQLKITDDDSLVISTYTFNIMVQQSTDGLSEEQLGINPQDLMNAAATIEAFAVDFSIADALLQIASKVAYVDEHGQDYYDALYNALYSPY